MKIIIIVLLMSCTLCLGGCRDNQKADTLIFATSADYPPFEYYENTKMTGFDIELAELIAHEMGKTAVFENMQFSGILIALHSAQVDAAISTITMTDERKHAFDFSDPYYFETMAIVFSNASPIKNQNQLIGKKIACQLGTTMELWLKKYHPDSEIVSFDNTNQAIEALKAGHVDGVLIDGVQGSVFSHNNPGLAYLVISKSDAGYGIAFPKGSPLRASVNAALKALKEKGAVHQLEQKWFEVDKWKK